MALPTLTEEQRKENLAKAQETRKRKTEDSLAYAKEFLKIEYADEPHWKKLASKYKIRLPVWHEQYSAKAMRKVLKKLGRTSDWSKEYWGCGLNEVGNLNPTWTCREVLRMGKP